MSVADPVSAEACLAGLQHLFDRACAPWSVMDPRDWVQSIRRMPDEHGATKPFSFHYAPYEREPFDEIFNPRNQEVVFQWASRIGKSETVLNALGYTIDQRPCRIGAMWPTLGQGKKWSKDDFTGSLIEPTPALSALIANATGRRKSDNTLLHKIFTGGLIDIVGANAPGDLRRMKARFLYADEIDAIVEISTDEGDQLAIFKKRGAEFADTVEVYCSYPSLKRRSRIEAKLLETDHRQWHVLCPKCGGEPFVMHRIQLRYDREAAHAARLECPRCQELLNDQDRYAMMRAGAWKATREYKGKAGFWANSFLWPHPVDPARFRGGYLQKYVEELIAAENAPNPMRARRVFVNTNDAETFEFDFEHKPEHTALFLRREPYDPRVMLPAGVLAIFFFVDVQADRLELFIDGFGAKNQIWGLDYQIIKGTPLAPADQGCWAELDRIILQARYPHPSGRYLAPQGGLIDCGYKPDNVFAFTRPRSRQRIYSSRGATTLGKPIIGRRAKREGNPPAKVWELGTNECKDIIYQRLELDNIHANGYQHFPILGQFSEQYFAMLVAEDSEMKRAGDGKFYRAFGCDNGVRNEALDGRVGTMAAERIVKPNYKRLAEELAVKKDTPPVGQAFLPAVEKPKDGNEDRRPAEPPPPRRPFVRNLRPYQRRSGSGRRGGSFVRGWR